MKIYIAGPMSGRPFLNRDAFMQAERTLRKKLGPFVEEVFNPVRLDLELYGDDFFDHCPNGIPEETKSRGFDLRKSLGHDLKWICENASHIYMLEGWEHSKGAAVEHALARALNIEILYEMKV